MRFPGHVSQKILLLLLGGAALGFSRSPGQYARVLRAMKKEWREINRHDLYRQIRRLYESKLISYRERDDGVVDIVLTREGKKVALSYRVEEMVIPKPKEWDHKWRVILFDIPERQKVLRDTLRMKLRHLGLLEFQKSVFIYPYDCRNEIDFVIELYQARRYVRFIEAIRIDTGLHLKKKFGLLKK